MQRWVLGAGIVVVVLAMTGARVQAQEPPAGAATCKAFAGVNLGSVGDSDRDFESANFKKSAPMIEAWMNEQLAAGRTRFVSTPVFTNAGVLCAW